MSEEGLRELDRRMVIGDKLILILEEKEATREYFLTLKTNDGQYVHVFTNSPDSAWFSTSYLLHLYNSKIKSTDPELQYAHIKGLERGITNKARDMFCQYRQKHKKQFQ